MTNDLKRIDKYSFYNQNLIGSGYTSDVYKGINQITSIYNSKGQSVAIKIIKLSTINDPISKSMLNNQIEVLKLLNHPNVIHCYDVFFTNNNCYIITQYCEGGDLSGILKKKKFFQQDLVMHIFKDIFNGYIHIAQNNILHRDIKPANIFLTAKGCLIADFGFAKKNTTPGIRQRYNVGSPLYMSPQSLKKNIYTIKNDIWSIGIILYQMIYGITPWQCSTQSELIRKISNIPVEFPKQKVVTQEMKDLIRKCLTVDQQKRISLQEMKRHPLTKKFEEKVKIQSAQKKSIEKQNNKSLEIKAYKHLEQNVEKVLSNKFNNIEDKLRANKYQKIEQQILSKYRHIQTKIKKNYRYQQEKTHSNLQKERQKSYNKFANFSLHYNQEQNKQLQKITNKTNKASQTTKRITNLSQKIFQKQQKFLRTFNNKIQKLPQQLTTKNSLEIRVNFKKNSICKGQIIKSTEINKLKISKEQNKEQKMKIKQNQKILIFKINECRFLFKFSKHIQTTTQNKKQQTQALLYLLRKDLIKKISLLKKMETSKLNIFQMKGFQQFIQWTGYKRYKLVILQYYKKYMDYFNQRISIPHIKSKEDVCQQLLDSLQDKQCKDLITTQYILSYLQLQNNVMSFNYLQNLLQFYPQTSNQKSRAESLKIKL